MGQDQNGTGDAGRVDQPAVHEQLPFDQFIGLDELLDELPVGFAWKGQKIPHPSIQQILSLQVFPIPQVEEKVEPDPEIALGPCCAREQPDLIPDPFSGDVSEGIDEAIDIQALEPVVERPCLQHCGMRYDLAASILATVNLPCDFPSRLVVAFRLTSLWGNC